MATDKFPIFPPPVYVPIFSNVETAWTDNYAPFRIATKYAGIEMPKKYRVLCYWPHGCDLPIREIDPDLVTGCLPIPKQMPFFTGRRETRDFMREHGFRNVKSIGLPIVYTEEFEYPRKSGSLLVMPMHSIDGERFEEKAAFEKYVQEVAEISKNFSDLTVVIHQSCIRNKLWLREFQSIGAKIVPGAYPNDANSLARIKILLQQHEFMTTNEWGSHVAYALAFGAKVSIWGTTFKRDVKHHSVDIGWKSRPDLAKLIFSEDFELKQRQFLQKFHLHPESAVADQEWGNWLIGMDQKLSRQEMADSLFEMIDGLESNTRKSTPTTSSNGASSEVAIFPTALETPDQPPAKQEVPKGRFSNLHWTQLDQIYTDCRRELSLRSDEWRYGPERVMQIAKEAHDYLSPHGSIVGKFYCDLGCGIYHPYGVASIMYLNGARETLSTDLQPSNPRRAAEALADLLVDVTLDPDRWHWTTFPRADFLSRLQSFHLKSLKNGDLSTGIRGLPLRYILTDIHNPALPVGKIDFMASRAVLEHFLDFPRAMARMRELLAPGGIAFHNIDLVDHRAYESQSFHWWSFLAEGDAYSDGVCNRLRASEILGVLEEKGFEILFREPHRDKMPEGFLEKIQGRFRQLSVEDLETTSIKVTVRKTSAVPDASAETGKETKFHETGEPAASSLFPTNHQDVESSDFSKLKILIFSDDPGQGGVAHHGHSLITALLKAGATVISAQPEMQSPLVDEQRSMGAEIVWTAYNPSKEFLRSAEDEADAERIMALAQPDLVIFNDSCVMSHIAAKNVAINNLLPFVSICNTDTEYLAARFPQLMPSVGKNFQFAEEVVAVSESVLTTLRRTFGLSREKGVVVYYGRPKRFFEPKDSSVRARVRKELGVPEAAVLCLTTARVVADKGYQFQIEAIKKLKATGRLGNLFFAWAGEGDLRQKFTEIVETSELGDHVKILGYRWDVENLMAAADVFLLPSLVEAMPLSIMEAMAMEIPVIASAIAGVPEELGETGCLLPDPGKEPLAAVEKMMRTLEEWASNPELRAQIGRDSKLRADMLFREEVMASKMLPIIASAAKTRNRELAVRKANFLSRSGELKSLANTYRKTVEGTDAKPEDLIDFQEEELAEFQKLVTAFQSDVSNPSLRSQIGELRMGLVNYLTSVPPKSLKALFGGGFGKAYQIVYGSGIQDEVPDVNEVVMAGSMLGGFCEDGEFDFRRLAADMLFRRAHRAPCLLALELVPSWFFDDYVKYCIFAPDAFSEIGEADAYRCHIASVVEDFAQRIARDPKSPPSMRLCQIVATHLNLIPLLFNREGNREIYKQRAKIIAHFLESRGMRLDAPAKKAPSHRRRIKVGFLNAHFSSQTETYTSIPGFSHLDRNRFEVVVYSLNSGGGVLEDYCRDRANEFIVLPQGLDAQVKKIREDALDAIVIGTNVTAVTNPVALLASFRLAPVQLLNNSSPVTSGMAHMDGYLSGSFLVDSGTAAQYSEKVLELDGPAHCFNYEVDRRAPVVNLRREDLGIPDGAVVFFSGANCFKIIPEMQEAWARILSRVPDSYLMLHPFNPNWSNKYPVLRFERSMRAALQRHGVDAERLVLSRERLPSRSDVLELIKLADVYLDSFPFAGVNSAVDPLEVGVPLVACEMETFRSKMAGSLLRELKIEELIAEDESGYIDLAVKLGTDGEYRRSISAQITDAMGRNPSFLDSEKYSENLGRIVESLLGRSVSQQPFPPASATLEVAVSAFNAGRLAEAEDVCRELLQADEKCAGAWNLMARMAALNGDLETAGDFGAVACELEPGNAGFVRFLAEVNLGRGELEPAEALVRRALEILPEDAASLALLGRVLCEKGEKGDSLAAFQQAQRLRKDDAEICAHYAQALQKMDRGKDAISQMRKAVSLAPDSVEHRTSLGMMLEENKRYADALASYEKALELRDDVGFVWYRKGKLLNGLQRYAEGAEAMQRAVELPGAMAEAYYEYGLSLHMSKRVIEALAQYDRAAAMGLEKHEMHCNRGVILKEINRHGDAIQAFYKAVRLAPENEHYVNNLGAAALDIGLNSEALECFQDAVAANPNLQTAQNNIGNLLKDRGRGAEALPHYRRSMELAEGKFAASRLTKNNYLLCFQYLPEISPEAVFEEHRKWGMESVKLIRPAFNHTGRKVPAGEKLRVGFVSADFCQHPVGVFMEPLLRELAAGRFEIFAYADYKKADSVSERMKATVPNWRETGTMTDAELAKMIHEDGIDVLFELTGHTALNRLDLFALKPAPVQATYLGYPSTTGLPTIDFRLTDANADPAGMTEKFHTERLVRIAECAWCFAPHIDTPEVGPLPALQRGAVTFACFNNMAKWNEPLYELWLEILRRVPGSRLRLKARTLLDNEVRGELETWFAERGIERARLEFSGHARGIGNHLREYNKVDIALDSYPYHGTTTTCEALWMGCPVVTLEGPSHVSRVGVSLLKTVGLADCIAKTREGYIEKAVALAGDLDALTALRSGMRERLTASPLLDSPGFARRFENAIDDMVKAAMRR